MELEEAADLSLKHESCQEVYGLHSTGLDYFCWLLVLRFWFCARVWKRCWVKRWHWWR